MIFTEEQRAYLAGVFEEGSSYTERSNAYNRLMDDVFGKYNELNSSLKSLTHGTMSKSWQSEMSPSEIRHLKEAYAALQVAGKHLMKWHSS